MASALRKMTSVGADVRQIAALLQAKAPKGHMLAYITPQEAALLKAEGGSGKPQADTGIPSFEVGATGGLAYDDSGPGNVVSDSGDGGYVGEPQQVIAQNSDLYPAGQFSNTPGLMSNFYPSGEKRYGFYGPRLDGSQPSTSRSISAPPPPEISIFGNQPVNYQAEFGGAPIPEIPSTYAQVGQPTTTAELQALAGRLGPTGEAPKTPAEGGYADQLSKALGISKGDLAKLGITGVQAVLGGKQATQAREAGQAGKRDIQAVAAPYQAKGQELQAAAQRGELTPTGQQAIAAARAQAAQGAERRGGVGAQQMEAQVQALRNQLLQQQYDYGLKLSGIGDQMALGAIRTGMQADQYANQLTSSYFNNIARIAAGTPPAATPGAT